MLIDKTYFIGEINIAQLSQPAVQAALTLFIEKREPEYLEKALGYEFYQLFTAGITAEEQRYEDLRDGAEYNNSDGHLKKWKGLITTDKRSPIANYIYYWHMRDNVTFTAGTGEKEGKSDNAGNASPAIKMIRAWNEMVDWTIALYDYLLYKKDEDGELIYPEFDIDQVTPIEKMNIFNL